MPEPNIAIVKEGAKWQWRLVAWLYRRTFKMSPGGWIAATTISGSAAAVGATQLLPSVEGILTTSVPGVIAAAGAGALLNWSRQARRSKRLIVFLSPFDERSADTTSVAPLQVDALTRMIVEDPLLSELIDVRKLWAPLDVKSSSRLLAWTKGHACVSGEVIAAGGRSRWTPWLAVRWTWSTGLFGRRRVRLGPPRLHPPRTEQMDVDAGVPIAVFAERDFSTAHARGIRAALLLLAAGELVQRDSSVSEACRVAARRDFDALPTLLRALLVILEAQAPDATSFGDWAERRAREIASNGAASADHPYLWKEVASLMTIAEREGLTSPSARLPFARRALAGDPSDPVAAFGLGNALVAAAEERALAHEDFEGAKELCAEAIPELKKALSKLRGN